MTSLSCGAPSGSVPRSGRRPHYSLGARMSDLIHIDNLGPFGNPVATVTSITTLWVVGGRGQSSLFLHSFLITSVLSCSSWACLPVVPSPKRRDSAWWDTPPPIGYLLSPVLITEPERMWVFSRFFSKACVKFHSGVTFLIIIVSTDYKVGVYHLLPYAARHITICGIPPNEFPPDVTFSRSGALRLLYRLKSI